MVAILWQDARVYAWYVWSCRWTLYERNCHRFRADINFNLESPHSIPSQWNRIYRFYEIIQVRRGCKTKLFSNIYVDVISIYIHIVYPTCVHILSRRSKKYKCKLLMNSKTWYKNDNIWDIEVQKSESSIFIIKN